MRESRYRLTRLRLYEATIPLFIAPLHKNYKKLRFILNAFRDLARVVRYEVTSLMS